MFMNAAERKRLVHTAVPTVFSFPGTDTIIAAAGVSGRKQPAARNQKARRKCFRVRMKADTLSIDAGIANTEQNHLNNAWL